MMNCLAYSSFHFLVYFYIWHLFDYLYLQRHWTYFSVSIRTYCLYSPVMQVYVLCFGCLIHCRMQSCSYGFWNALCSEVVNTSSFNSFAFLLFGSYLRRLWEFWLEAFLNFFLIDKICFIFHGTIPLSLNLR